MATRFKITYADGSEGTLIGSEDAIKKAISEGDTYEAVVPPEPTEEQIKFAARLWRDNALSATDWVIPISDHPQRDAYIALRQNLRQWPETSEFPSGTRPTLGS